jgi:hypothetical protein
MVLRMAFLFLLLSAAGLTTVAVAAGDSPATSGNASSGHWAFRPLGGAAVPPVKRSDWVRTSVDAFILSRLEEQGLGPSPVAPKSVLLRRLSANLLGLPPSAGLFADFIADRSPEAYQKLLERLLDSPHYGERWGRHWLDVARFAESTGFVENHNKPHFWRFRDWVVNSFNTDKPYDVFITQQLAGDELEPYADENLVATGFLASARLASEELSCIRQEGAMYVDMVNATSAAMLGLTMGCAQCHDHMFDDLTQEDYFRLHAFFLRGYPGNVVLGGDAVPEEVHQAATNFHTVNLAIRKRVLEEGVQEESAELQKIWAAAPAERTPQEEALFRVRRAALNIRVAGCNGYRITKDEKKEFDEAKAAIDKYVPQLTQTWGFYSPVTSPHRISTLLMAGNFPLIHNVAELGSRQAYLLSRGDPYQTETRLKPGFPEALMLPGEQNATSEDTFAEKSRLDLARWLTRRGTPAAALVARVWVNRIWSYHFGRGLVGTPGNFGVRGERPTHPELLEYLASELIDSGWSTKHIQRLIVKSNTYQQSASTEFAATDGQSRPQLSDPDNRLYWKWPTRRLEAEAVRDMMLAVSGQLDNSVGGPSVPVGQSSYRRSIYLFQRRDAPGEMQALFDAPTAMSASCARRQVSTSPLQPLFLLNSQKSAAWSENFARKVISQLPENTTGQVDLVFEKVLGRRPGAREQQEAVAYLEAAMKEPVESGAIRPRISRLDFPEERQFPLAGPRPSILATRPSSLGQYVLHSNGYQDHTPDPEVATVTFTFNSPVTVAEIELLVHVNGISRLEGFVGDAVDRLVSIGEASTSEAGRGKQFPRELAPVVFAFAPEKCREATVFRFVVRETVKVDGYANYQVYPRTTGHERILPTLELVPDAPSPMSPLAKFCQAMMNLNEFFYVP